MWYLFLPLLTSGLVIFQGAFYYGEDAVELILITPMHELCNINVDRITPQELAEIPSFIKEHLALPKADVDPFPVMQPAMKYSYSFGTTFPMKENFAPMFSRFAIRVHRLSKIKLERLPQLPPATSVARFDFVRDERLSISNCFEPRTFNFDYDWKVRSRAGVDARLAAWNLLHGIYILPDDIILTEWALITLVFQDATLGGDVKTYVEWLCSVPLHFAVMLDTSEAHPWKKSLRLIKKAAVTNSAMWQELLQLAIERIGDTLIIPKLEEWRKNEESNHTVRQIADWENVERMQQEWRQMKIRSKALESRPKEEFVSPCKARISPCKLKIDVERLDSIPVSFQVDDDEDLPSYPDWLDD